MRKAGSVNGAEYIDDLPGEKIVVSIRRKKKKKDALISFLNIYMYVSLGNTWRYYATELTWPLYGWRHRCLFFYSCITKYLHPYCTYTLTAYLAFLSCIFTIFGFTSLLLHYTLFDNMYS